MERIQICEILCYSLTSQKSCEKIHEILTIEQSPDKSLGLSQQQILQFVYYYFPSQLVLRQLLCFMQEVTINKKVLIHHFVTAVTSLSFQYDCPGP